MIKIKRSTKWLSRNVVYFSILVQKIRIFKINVNRIQNFKFIKKKTFFKGAYNAHSKCPLNVSNIFDLGWIMVKMVKNNGDDSLLKQNCCITIRSTLK